MNDVSFDSDKQCSSSSSCPRRWRPSVKWATCCRSSTPDERGPFPPWAGRRAYCRIESHHALQPHSPNSPTFPSLTLPLLSSEPRSPPRVSTFLLTLEDSPEPKSPLCCSPFFKPAYRRPWCPCRASSPLTEDNRYHPCLSVSVVTKFVLTYCDCIGLT